MVWGALHERGTTQWPAAECFFKRSHHFPADSHQALPGEGAVIFTKAWKAGSSLSSCCPVVNGVDGLETKALTEWLNFSLLDNNHTLV